jgi:hypothetical protein
MADDPAVRSVVEGTAGDPERTALDDLARELGPREQWAAVPHGRGGPAPPCAPMPWRRPSAR